MVSNEYEGMERTEFQEYLTTGDSELDKVLGGGIRRGTLIVILGHPGAGKTTFLAKVTYVNMATKKLKVLYVSLAENRSKFYAFTKMLGLHFERFEKEGLFKFLEVPSVTGELMDILTSSLVGEVSKFKPDIVVIDSITPVLKVFGKHPDVREFLHSGIYKLTGILGVTVFLIADLPYGTESVDLGGLEFVADGVMVFKTKIKNGLITRWMEVRKMRGAPITLAEIPFTIVKEQGVKAFVVPLLSEIPLYKVDETVSFGCRLLDEKVGRMPRGAQITVIYPLGMNTPRIILAWLAKFIAINRLKTMVISYIQPGRSLAYHIKKSAEELGFTEKN